MAHKTKSSSQGSDSSNPHKLVVFGSGGVGKSSITLRFCTGTFNTEYLPTIEDLYRKTVMVDGESAFLDILDTAGQEDYSSLRDQWVREGRGFVLVYSVTNRATFEELQQFRERILMVNDDEAQPMVIVGNKCDLDSQREVKADEARRLADKWGAPYIECSALSGLNCSEVFHALVREVRVFDERARVPAPAPPKQSRWCTIL